jgi:hypothetical protein
MEMVSKFLPKVQERAIRLVEERVKEHSPQWTAICSVTKKIGYTPETLGRWIRQSEKDQGKSAGLTTDERELLPTVLLVFCFNLQSSLYKENSIIPVKLVYFVAYRGTESHRVCARVFSLSCIV